MWMPAKAISFRYASMSLSIPRCLRYKSRFVNVIKVNFEAFVEFRSHCRLLPFSGECPRVWTTRHLSLRQFREFRSSTKLGLSSARSAISGSLSRRSRRNPQQSARPPIAEVANVYGSSRDDVRIGRGRGVMEKQT